MPVNSVNRHLLQATILAALSKAKETISTPPPPPTSDAPASVEKNPFQNPFSTDGFESPGAGGTPDLTQRVQEFAQTLEQIMNLLGEEQGAGEEGVPELGGPSGGGPTPQQAAPPPTTPPATTPPASEPATQKTQAPQEAQAPADNNPTGDNKNIADFPNHSSKPLTITFTPNAGQQQIPPLTVPPGETVSQEFPKGWSGNFRGERGDGTAVTLGEVAFNGNNNQTFYDVSYIEGNNLKMMIEPKTAAGKTSGTLENITEGASDNIMARDAQGQVYGIKKSTHAEVRDPNVINHYRGKISVDQGYADPKDDLSTRSTSDTHLVVHLNEVF